MDNEEEPLLIEAEDGEEALFYDRLDRMWKPVEARQPLFLDVWSARTGTTTRYKYDSALERYRDAFNYHGSSQFIAYIPENGNHPLGLTRWERTGYGVVA